MFGDFVFPGIVVNVPFCLLPLAIGIYIRDELNDHHDMRLVCGSMKRVTVLCIWDVLAVRPESWSTLLVSIRVRYQVCSILVSRSKFVLRMDWLLQIPTLRILLLSGTPFLKLLGVAAQSLPLPHHRLDLIIVHRPLRHLPPCSVQFRLLRLWIIAQIDCPRALEALVAAPCLAPQPLLW